jgi:hypothetical protein
MDFKYIASYDADIETGIASFMKLSVRNAAIQLLPEFRDIRNIVDIENV